MTVEGTNTHTGRNGSASVDRPVVLLTGASSQLGVFLIPHLIKNGYRVLAVSRRSLPTADVNSNPLWTGSSFIDGSGVAGRPDIAPESVEFMVSCGPPELVIKAIPRFTRLRRLVIYSTTSVYTKTASRISAEREQMAEILKQENIIRVLCEKSNVDWVFFRATLIYGCGLDRNISLLRRWIDRFGWLPVAGAASGRRQPVHAEDLANLAVGALQANGKLQLDSPVCGGSVLTYRQMVERVFDGLGKKRRVIGLPGGLLSAAVGMLRFSQLSGKVNTEMFRRQNIDLVFDDRAVRKLFGYQPRRFEPGPSDFEIPPEAAQYQISQSPGPG